MEEWQIRVGKSRGKRRVCTGMDEGERIGVRREWGWGWGWVLGQRREGGRRRKGVRWMGEEGIGGESGVGRFDGGRGV